MPDLGARVAPWGSLRDSIRRASSLGRDDLEASNKLEAYPAPLLSNLLKEQLLFNIGLSPLNPAGTVIYIYIYFICCFPFLLVLLLSCVNPHSLQIWMPTQLEC